jgi:hypothetical protein
MNLDVLLFDVWQEAGVVKCCPTDEEYYYVGIGGPALDEAYGRALRILQKRIESAADGYDYYAPLDEQARTKKLEFALELLPHGSCPWCAARNRRRKAN